jgi:hypothetical protein
MMRIDEEQREMWVLLSAWQSRTGATVKHPMTSGQRWMAEHREIWNAERQAEWRKQAAASLTQTIGKPSPKPW